MNIKLLLYCNIILCFLYCKSIAVKPTEFIFDGLILNSNFTYEKFMGQHDSPSEVINLGEYQYIGDTLKLMTNVELYVSKLTEPKVTNCEENLVRIRFKEYIYGNERSNMNMNWFHMELKALNSENDTTTVWRPNSFDNNTNFYEVVFNKKEFNGLKEIWLEFWNQPTTKPINLPKNYNCMEITIPILLTINGSQLSESLSLGMNELLIKRKNRMYIVESPRRNKVYRIKNCK